MVREGKRGPAHYSFSLRYVKQGLCFCSQVIQYGTILTRWPTGCDWPGSDLACTWDSAILNGLGGLGVHSSNIAK